MLVFGAPAMAEDGGAPVAQGMPLFLEVILNGLPTGLIAAFTERADGSLAISAQELAELGILPEPSALAPDGQYDLDAMPGLTYRFDSVQQVVTIDTEMSRLKTRVIDLGENGGAPALSETAPGMAMNYSLYGSLADHAFAASVALDARAFWSGGLVTQSGIVGYLPDRSFSALRLDTTFTRSDPATLRTFRAGDFISGGLSWTRPVRLGGVQLARSFELRPDLVTMPVPTFDGTAAVPSTIDVFANGSNVYSASVAAGPFSITNVPILSNAGTARLVVTDAAGRTVETSQPFFTSPRLLRAGLLDYSVEAGLPRRNFGVESFDYVATPAASGSVRYGLTDTLTLEGHVEATSGLVNGGIGLVAPLGGIGLGAVAVAGSAGNGIGALVSGDLSLQFGDIRVRLASRHTIGDYADIASATAEGSSAKPTPAFDQASLSLPIGRSGTDATFSATRTVLTDGTERSILGVSWGRRLFGNANLSLYGYQEFGDKPGTGMLLGLSMPLGDAMSASSSASLGSPTPSGNIEVSKSERAAGGWGWRVGAGGVGGEAPAVNWLAAASYRGMAARAAAGVRSLNGQTSASAELSGAIVAAGGGVFLTRRFSDAFAVVDAGAPDVVVKSENAEVGRTNGAGKLLIPDLRSWQVNHLSIDTENLPLDMEAEETRKVVVPAGRSGVVVDFGVSEIGAAAIVVFRDASGAFVPAGTVGEMEDGEAFVVGYDGQAYLRKLQPQNRVTIALAESDCTAAFDYAPQPGEPQPLIEGVTCQ